MGPWEVLTRVVAKRASRAVAMAGAVERLCGRKEKSGRLK
jgi:hypothetical protein